MTKITKERLIEQINAKLKDRAESSREAKIISHYEMEVDRGHMTIPIAALRAASDIVGNNNHPDKPQRG